MKRREVRERDDAAARDQAEQRTEALLARLRARESDARPRTEEDVAAPEPEAPEPEDAPPIATSKPRDRPR